MDWTNLSNYTICKSIGIGKTGKLSHWKSAFLFDCFLHFIFSPSHLNLLLAFIQRDFSLDFVFYFPKYTFSLSLCLRQKEHLTKFILFCLHCVFCVRSQHKQRVIELLLYQRASFLFIPFIIQIDFCQIAPLSVFYCCLIFSFLNELCECLKMNETDWSVVPIKFDHTTSDYCMPSNWRKLLTVLVQTMYWIIFVKSVPCYQYIGRCRYSVDTWKLRIMVCVAIRFKRSSQPKA